MGLRKNCKLFIRQRKSRDRPCNINDTISKGNLYTLSLSLTLSLSVSPNFFFLAPYPSFYLYPSPSLSMPLFLCLCLSLTRTVALFLISSVFVAHYFFFVFFFRSIFLYFCTFCCVVCSLSLSNSRSLCLVSFLPSSTTNLCKTCFAFVSFLL